MQPIISYVYEYEGNRRIRNAGFLKLLPQGSSFLFNLHIKSPLIRSGTSWNLYAFSSDGSICTLYPITELTGEQHSFHKQFLLNPEFLPKGQFPDSMDGFWISENSLRVFAAAWKPTFVDSGKFKIWEEPKVLEELPPAASVSTEPEITETTVSESTASKPTASESTASESTASESVQTDSEPSVSANNLSGDVREKADIPSDLQFWKIQRRDLTRLPRKDWYLANNSFLLHGYHNYHHLLLVEKDGSRFLGVPGIYDKRESHAAELFGFPRFSPEYAPLLDLSEEECNSGCIFGHYLRKVH